MGFYDDEQGVQTYLEMAEGYDGREQVAILRRHLPSGATVLELGMGPGKDLDMLAEHYDIIGSDASTVFLERYRALRPQARLLQLDAVTLQTDLMVDAIYSNKVLHHLTVDELRLSLLAQLARLRPGGLLLHTFWRGDQVEFHGGMRFQQYRLGAFEALLPAGLEVIEHEVYGEMEPEDSLMVVVRRGGDAPSPSRPARADPHRAAGASGSAGLPSVGWRWAQSR